MTPWMLQNVINGNAFFAGVALLLIAIGLRISFGPVRRRVAALVSVLGVLLIVISATPLPWLAYAVGFVLGIAWFIATGRAHSGESESHSASLLSRRVCWSAAFATALIVLIGMEFRWRLPPKLPAVRCQTLTVIGDSVTAGIGEGKITTWPRLLDNRFGVAVHDLSRMGATVSSVNEQLRADKISPGLVIVEIGGNDILGTTSVESFAAELDELCSRLQADHRFVLMMELPLPLFFNRFGQAQRHVAARHHIPLIPKSVLASVLLDSATTLDSIHLNQAGQNELAEAIWEIVGRSLSSADEHSAEFSKTAISPVVPVLARPPKTR